MYVCINFATMSICHIICHLFLTGAKRLCTKTVTTVIEVVDWLTLGTTRKVASVYVLNLTLSEITSFFFLSTES